MDILLIEDSLSDQQLFKDRLGKIDLNHEICFEVVSKIEDAISLLQNIYFSMIFLDLTLPGTTGWTTLESMVKVKDTFVNPNTNIVVLSGLEDYAQGRKALADNIILSYIVKSECTVKDIERCLKSVSYQELMPKRSFKRKKKF